MGWPKGKPRKPVAGEETPANPSGNLGTVHNEPLTAASVKPDLRKTYWCRRPFDYGLPTKSYDRGEFIRLQELRNDEKLLRLGYIAEFTGRDKFECGRCSCWFVDMGCRDGHVKMRHLRREGIEVAPVTMAGEFAYGVDVSGQRDEAKLEQLAPLYLDKTSASRG